MRMKILATAAVSAALLAAAATQIYHTLLAPNPLALLVLFFASAALTAGAAVQVMRRARSAAERAPARQRPQRPRSAPPQPRGGRREMGAVKWFDGKKGYGFIVRSDGGEIFFHHREVRRSGASGDGGRAPLGDGQRVSFIPRRRDRGWQAEDVIPECTSRH